MFALIGCALAPQALSQTNYFPKGTNLTRLYVISEGNLGNTAQRVLISTLQGIVARRSSEQIYIDAGSGYTFWKNHLRDAYSISNSTTSDPWFLVNRYKSFVSGYVLYDPAVNTNSLNAANSLCGPFNAIAVTPSLEPQIVLQGITNRIADVRTRDEAWVRTNYPLLLSSTHAFEQRETIAHHLRDYATLANGFTFFDGNSSFRRSVMDGLAPDAVCLGWGDASFGEDRFVGDSSSNGVFTVPADWALNLSTLSSVRDAGIQQFTYTNPVTETNVHYVTFVVTDGDNVQWNLGDFPSYFSHPDRGRFNMGWALSPSLAELAPSVLRWYFTSAVNGLRQDFFVAGPSGGGYFYPSKYPTAALDLHVQKLATLMVGADLDIVQIIDFNAFARLDLWNRYLNQSAIDALFYLEYSPYNGAGGAVLFSTNGKPVIAAREMLWGGLSEEANVIAQINSAPRDPSSAAGYSLVSVHVWSKNLANIRQVVTNLASDVRVVTPNAFAKLIRQNVGRRLAFNFSNGLQGWTGKISGKQYDQAQWTASEGSGALLFDGSDLGIPDTSPNSWFTRQIHLPLNATTLSFATRAVNDGHLRVRLQQPNGSFSTLLNWESLAHQDWVTRTASLSNFAGQVVTLYFEQNDGGQGNGEYRYVDDVAILTSGPPQYLPPPPRLLAATPGPGTGVTLRWRDNSNDEDNFHIERKLGSEPWVEIENVSSNTTTWVDGSALSGTNYSYRVQAWNSAGPSAYSNERTVNTPPRPLMVAALSNGSVTLRWPGWATNYALQAASNLASIWSSVTNQPTNAAGEVTVTMPTIQTQRFFRLKSE